MPDLLEKIWDETTTEDSLERAWNQPQQKEYDPKKEYEEIENIVDMKIDLPELDMRDIQDNYRLLVADPQDFKPPKVEDATLRLEAYKPTKWEKIKKFLIGEPTYYLPPDADRLEKAKQIFDGVMSNTIGQALKIGKGGLLGLGEIAWAVIKRETPQENWDDEVRNMSLNEAMDWHAGYKPGTLPNIIGDISEFAARIQAVAPLAQKIGLIGNTPKDISVLQKAAETAKLFGGAAVVEQTAKLTSEIIDPTEAEYGYEGPKAVLRDMAIGAAFSIVSQGVSKIWKVLTPNEQTRALKLLGLKKGASPEEITKASRKMALKYHPDKVKGFEEEFKKVIKARDLLRKGEPQDIVFRGQKVTFKPKLLEGETVEQQAIRLKKAPRKPVEAKHPLVTPKEAEKVQTAKAQAQEVVQEEQPWEMTKKEYGKQESKVNSNVSGINLVDRAGNKPLYPQSWEWKLAERMQEKIKNEGHLEIYDQAQTGSLYGNIVFNDGRIYPIRISDHPTKTNLNILNKARKEAKFLGEGQHKEIVQKALSENKPVPREVLEEYKGEKWADEALAKMVPSKTEQVIEKLTSRNLESAPEQEISKTIDENIGFEKGFAEVPRLSFVKEVYERAHDWIYTFGETRRKNPELYDKLFKAFGKRNAAVEKAISKLEKIIPKQIKIYDDVNLSISYEDKRLTPPKDLEETYNAYSEILDEIERKQLAEGIFKQKFQERMIEENNVRIDALKAKLIHPENSVRIQRLIAENEQLKNMRYLPHSNVARAVIEERINRLPHDKRKAMLDKLSYIYKKRKGKLFLKDYLKEGIIEKDDIRMSRLAAQSLTSYYYRSALKELHEYAKANDLIKPVSDDLRAEGWLNQREIGITSPELKEQLVHPLYAQALREMVEMRHGRGSLRQQIFGMVKIGQFIKPTIIYTYNAVQKYFRGMYSLNPKHEVKNLTEAFSIVLNQTPEYHKLNESNLYQFPYEVSRAAQEEQIQAWINQHNPDIEKAIKWFEKTTETPWFGTDVTLGKATKNLLMAAHRAVARYTWLGDKVQRTQSYLTLRQMGYPHDEAVKVASQGHGGYSLLSRKYKEFMSKYFFVYSFRWLMPIEMGKTLVEPITDGLYNYVKTGEKPPRHKMERWAKAWIGAVAIPVMIDSYMRWRGFEPDDKHLGPLAWKYKKTVVVDGQENEIVVGLNYILNQPIKYWQRFSSYDPIRPETRWMQSLKNVAKWEIHPLYRIFFWDISQNRRSFGAGQQVYNTEANPILQFGQISSYIMGQSFRFIGGMMDAVGEGSMTDKEKEKQKTILKEGLTSFDRILFKVLGYSYTRLPLEERKNIAKARLLKEIRTRGIKYGRKYEGQKLDEKMDELRNWALEIEKWIEEDMK